VPLIAVGGAVVLALRLLPHLVRLAGRLTRRGRGLIGFLGLTGAGRVPGSVVAAFSALAVGLGFGAFAAGTQTTVDRGQTMAAWETVGADYRVEAGSFLEEDVRRLQAVAGLETVLPGLDVPPSQVIAPTGEYTRTGLLAIDASAYADTLDSAPAGLVDPEALARIGATPSSDEPLPVLATPDVVTALQGRTGTLAPGSALPSGPIEVVGEIESFPVAGGGPVVVADLDALRAQVAPALVRPNMMLLRGSADAEDEVRAVAEAFPQATQVSVRATRLADVRGDPFVAATRQVFVGGSVVAGGYCALAVVLALLLGGRARAGTRSTLRMLGASARATSRISILELAPLAALMVATGALVGYLLPWAVLPAIELATFTGGTRPPEVHGDAVTALLSGAGALAVVGLALVIANTTRRRADPSAVPGWGEEE
jgi:putative ABC transport system permease protein